MKKLKRKIQWLVIVSIIAIYCSLFSIHCLFAEKAKSAILLIGDGMGPAIIGIAKNYSQFVLKKDHLNIEKLMNEGRVGMMMTYSASHLVTDSAAGATAFACGVKTYNEAIGVDEKGNAVETILEKAKKAGKSVGVITTCDLADATPAAFYAHAARRSQRNEIARQGIENKKVNLLLGGGLNFFDLAAAQKNGYTILKDKDALDQYRKEIPSKSPSFLLLGLFTPKEFPYTEAREKSVPSLTDMTRLSLEVLSRNEKGFFVMIEGGRIDHAGHANLAEKMLKEFLEFDEAVGVALEYQKRNLDTLVILTADHDTGGIALSKTEKGDEYPTIKELPNLEKIHWISENHTACPVLLVGKGPLSEKVKGLNDNTDVHKILKEALNLQ